MALQTVLTCSELLARQHLTIAFAESATAGRISAEFSLSPFSGKILKGGIICYDACVKEDLLKIPESAEVTAALAKALRNFIDADISVAVTGLTTPGGSETNTKLVGTIFIHALINGNPVAVNEIFTGGPEEIVMQTVNRVALLISDAAGS